MKSDNRPTATCYEVVNQTGQRLCNGGSCNAQESLRYVTSHGFPWIKLKQYAFHIFHLNQLKNVFSRIKECTLLQCFPYRCVGICRLSYFDSVRDYLLTGI